MPLSRLLSALKKGVKMMGLTLFSGNGKPAKLPEAVQEYMAHKFNLAHMYLGNLRCFKSLDQSDGQRLTRLRISSQDLLQQSKARIRTYADFDGRAEILLYDGYIDAKNNIHIDDQRIVSYIFSHAKSRV